ncbi:MAG: sialidase family protein [Acidobacteriota bacterium]
MSPSLALLLLALAAAPTADAPAPMPLDPQSYREVPGDPYLPPAEGLARTPAARIIRGGHVSVQVNVDGAGMNIPNDAANEPSIAVDPNDRDRIAIGWRQFDNIASDFRQAGYGWTSDGGATWTTGTIDAGVFRSDPILTADSAGRVYYNNHEVGNGQFSCDVFSSGDGGASWGAEIYAFGGDKAWMAVDPTPSRGNPHLYQIWSSGLGCCGSDHFNRSVDGGASFEAPIGVPGTPFWGTVAVGPDGEVYVAGARSGGGIAVARSTTLDDAGQPMSFDGSATVDLGGEVVPATGPNPVGLLGQVWVAVVQEGPRRGDVHVLASVDPPGSDPLDVRTSRSTDGGVTWSPSVRVNDDAGDAWQWFGTLSVAPDGRLDAVWNDTRADTSGVTFLSELYYASSEDEGVTWSVNEALSPAFDPHVGWPQQQKLGDYYDMVSDDDYAHLAWAATFNGEQDVYYLRLEANRLVFRDGFEGGNLGAWSSVFP